jgi:hypothetical protein
VLSPRPRSAPLAKASDCSNASRESDDSDPTGSAGDRVTREPAVDEPALPWMCCAHLAVTARIGTATRCAASGSREGGGTGQRIPCGGSRASEGGVPVRPELLRSVHEARDRARMNDDRARRPVRPPTCPKLAASGSAPSSIARMARFGVRSGSVALARCAEALQAASLSEQAPAGANRRDRSHLPCRRSRVRVPSSAPPEAPLRRGFLLPPQLAQSP